MIAPAHLDLLRRCSTGTLRYLVAHGTAVERVMAGALLTARVCDAWGRR